MSLIKNFSAKDLILITAIAAIGIAVKPIVGPLSKLISTPLGIPGGSFAGGFYMMWLSLAVAIIDKKYTGTVFGILQAILVLLVGMAGKQGAFSLVSYPLPGIVADICYHFYRKPNRLLSHLMICTLANITGAVVTGLIFFHLPKIMVAMNVMFATASGIMGGYLSYGVYMALKKNRIIT